MLFDIRASAHLLSSLSAGTSSLLDSGSFAWAERERC
jgi:hypothetical protein